jgi:hypothetical protein
MKKSMLEKIREYEAESRKRRPSSVIYGQDIMDSSRFASYTHHMIIYEIRSLNRGHIGTRKRVYLSDSGYVQAKDCEELGELKILRHAHVISGKLVFDNQERGR